MKLTQAEVTEGVRNLYRLGLIDTWECEACETPIVWRTDMRTRPQAISEHIQREHPEAEPSWMDKLEQ